MAENLKFVRMVNIFVSSVETRCSDVGEAV